MMDINLFVPLVGQYDNIGDVILRRELVRWLEKLGKLHVYVGQAPDHFVQGLDLPPEAVVHYRIGAWFNSALKAHGASVYVAKPGEVQLDFRGLKEHVGLLPLMIVNRTLRGRASVRVGVGARAGSLTMAPLVRAIFKLADLNVWRDDWTKAVMGFGSTMPDLAFGQGSTETSLRARLGSRSHGAVIVSYRGDRPIMGEQIVAAIRSLANASRSPIICVAQVQRDVERTKLLASLLGGSVHPWSSDYLRHERDLRGLYASARLVVSDRLHVLVAAATEGAPIRCVTDGLANAKISHHFGTVGLSDVATGTVDVAPSPSGLLSHSAPSETSVLHAVISARARLDHARTLLEQCLTRTVHDVA